MRNSTEKFRQKYATPFPVYPLRQSPLAFYRTPTPLSPRSPLHHHQPHRSSTRKLQTSRRLRSPSKTRRPLRHLPDQSIPRISLTRTNPKNLAADDVDSAATIGDLKWQPTESSAGTCRNPDEFIESLPANSLFFCCACCQYVFEIEKKRHHPDCKDRLREENRGKREKIGWQRLDRIVELARYVQVKNYELQQLQQEVKQNEFSGLWKINYPQDCQFLSLEEIKLAFVFTYEHLLQGAIYPPQSAYFCG